METQDNNIVMSVLTVIGAIIMGVLAAIGTVTRLLVTGKANLLNEIDLKSENAILKQKQKCAEELQSAIKDIRDDLAQIKRQTNGKF